MIDEMALRTELASRAKTFAPSNSSLGIDCLLRGVTLVFDEISGDRQPYLNY